MKMLPFFWAHNLEIRNSNMATTNIDFSNGYTATNLANPVNSLDVSNKAYVDERFNAIQSNQRETISLNGVGVTNAVQISVVPTRGVFILLVEAVTNGGPVARFSGFASSATVGDVALEGKSGGAGTVSGFVHLHFYKDSNDGTYHLYKDCDAVGDEHTFDGQYTVVSTASAPTVGTET